MYYVYILFSELDKQLYTGFCDDLKVRFDKHQKGFVKATKHRGELKIQLKEILTKLGYKNL